jgi:nucleoside-diphosphate-sugar epimerase
MNKKILIIGGDSNNFTKKQIVEKIFDHVPAGNVTFTDKTQDARNYKVDFSKIKKILNFEIKYSVDDGIKEIISYLKKNKIKDNKQNSEYGNYIIREDSSEN